jgi:ribosome biogenesis GTPase
VLDRIGFDTEIARWAGRWTAAADASVGRVVRVDRGAVSVLTDDGPHRASIGGGLLARMATDPFEGPCTGDWCVLRSWPDHRTTLEQVSPRRTAVVRAGAGKQSRAQLLCANADIAAAVVALHPEPPMSKVERLVALAWQSGAQPLVVLTKADMVSDAELVAEDVGAAAPGVEVVTFSTRTGQGLDRLRRLVDDRLTMALFGSSGHGKSSLTNALVGADVLTTRAIRDDGRGRHTSVRRELVPLPSGGAVIDTPGLRGIGMVDADEGLAHTFVDVEAFAAECRFDDCAHGGEPGCAVAEAVEQGVLSLRRFETWQHLQRELASSASRAEARVRAEQSGRAARAKAHRRGLRTRP